MDERELDMGGLLNLVGLSMGVVLYTMLLAMVVRAPSVSIAHGSGDRLPLLLPVAFVSRRQPGARRAVWIAALAAFAVSALHLAQLHTGRDPWPVELLGHHASVPLALAILYQDYPFAFADLFLKRALMLTALVAAAFIGIAALGLRGQGGGESLVIVGPRDVGLIVTLWVATALLYPWLHRGIGWFVDAIVLGRPDYSSLRAAVARRVQGHDQIGPLLDEVCVLLGPALSGESMSWHERSDAGMHSEAGVGSVVRIAHPSVTVSIPTSDVPQYAIVSGPLTGGRRLLSDDVLMLEALTVIIARRIDAIRLTHERHDRELREQEIAKLATEAELRALRAQVNPHFLFNALTTIGYLIQTAPPKALKTLMRLTALLRSVLRSEGEFTTLGRELEIVESYLEIERARFEASGRTGDNERKARSDCGRYLPTLDHHPRHRHRDERRGASARASAWRQPPERGAPVGTSVRDNGLPAHSLVPGSGHDR